MHKLKQNLHKFPTQNAQNAQIPTQQGALPIQPPNKTTPPLELKPAFKAQHLIFIWRAQQRRQGDS